MVRIALTSNGRVILSFLKSPLVAFCGMILAGDPACAQTWTPVEVSPDVVNLGIPIVSAGGTVLVLGTVSSSNYLYTSTNWGATWAQNPSTATTNNLALATASADGTKLTAIGLGAVYTSANSGDTWTLSPAEAQYVVSSADGTQLVAPGVGRVIAPESEIAYSTDSGTTWTAAVTPDSTNSWLGAASSADGATVVAIGASAGVPAVFTSSDYGASWTRSIGSFSGYLTMVASSADASKLIAAGITAVYTSTDYGATWAEQTVTTNVQTWDCLASSADGNRLGIGSASTSPTHPEIYSSFDGGLTWVSNNAPHLSWRDLSCSPDGVNLVMVPGITAGGSHPYDLYRGRLADIDVSISATPTLVDLQDMIQVTLTITNQTSNTVTNVQVSGSITLNGTGGVSFTGFSGPSVVPTLPA